MTERELTYEERAVWGTCPVCRAKQGEWCDGDVGLTLGSRPAQGVHLGRLRAAPIRIREVPIFT